MWAGRPPFTEKRRMFGRLRQNTTLIGSGLPVVVPSPSWPEVFEPQHFTLPFVPPPQVWSLPALRLLKSARPVPTATGVLVLTSVPSPSSPEKLAPQQDQLRPPGVSCTAQV